MEKCFFFRRQLKYVAHNVNDFGDINFKWCTDWIIKYKWQQSESPIFALEGLRVRFANVESIETKWELHPLRWKLLKLKNIETFIYGKSKQNTWAWAALRRNGMIPFVIRFRSTQFNDLKKPSIKWATERAPLGEIKQNSFDVMTKKLMKLSTN